MHTHDYTVIQSYLSVRDVHVFMTVIHNTAGVLVGGLEPEEHRVRSVDFLYDSTREGSLRNSSNSLVIPVSVKKASLSCEL